MPITIPPLPNTFASLSGNQSAATLDANFTTIRNALTGVALQQSDLESVPSYLGLPSGTVSAPSVRFQAEGTLGLFRIAATQLGIAAGGAAMMQIARTPIAFTALNGSSVVASTRILPVASGSTDQRGLVVEIAGTSGGTATPRLAGYFGAQTGGGAPGNDPIWGLNIIVQQNAAPDTNVNAIGVELNVNNNHTDDSNALTGPLHYAYSAESDGSRIAGIAYAVSGAAQWRRGVRIGTGSIATSGYAFEYMGDGTSGTVRITADSSLEVARLATFGGAAGTVGSVLVDPISSSPRSGRLVFGTDDGGWELRLSKRNGGTTTDLWALLDTGHWVPVTTEVFDLGSATRRVRNVHVNGAVITTGATPLEVVANTGAVGTVYGRIPVTVTGVGTRYIVLYNP